MEIITTTITARASANYQVGEVSIEIANYTEEELGQIQRYTVDKAVQICNDLQTKVNPNTPPVQPKTEVKNFNNNNQQRQPSYRTNTPPQNYQPPVQQAPVQQQAQQETKFVNGVQYKKCKNRTTGEIFWAIVDHSLITQNTPQYIKE